MEPADLVAIGSHCVGRDLLPGLHERGFRTKSLAVGSMGGLVAARRGERDIVGIHVLHPDLDPHDTPFLGPGPSLVRRYGRMQGIVFRPKDDRFAERERAGGGYRPRWRTRAVVWSSAVAGAAPGS